MSVAVTSTSSWPGGSPHALIDGWLRKARTLRSDAGIEPEGGASAYVHFVRSGWACQSRLLRGGRRQIVRLLLPGDIAGLSDSFLDRTTALSALTPAQVASIPLSQVAQAGEEDAALRATLASARRLEQAIGGELLVSLGRRDALERTGHLLCELFTRQHGVEGQPSDMPLTQHEVADLLGLSVVHVNRTMQTLRRLDLAAVSRHAFVLHDFDRLAEHSDFDPAYLQAA